MITVTGSLAFDYIMDYPGVFSDHIMPEKIHQINLSFLVNNLKKQRGGTAGNISYNLSLLNTPSSIIGCVGQDFSEYSKFLKNHGVDTSKIKILRDKFTSSAFIMTDKVDNQISGFYPGAMGENSKLSLTKTNADFAVISPNDTKAMIIFARECKKMRRDFMMDPGMQLPALTVYNLKEMISRATILIGNDYEISLLKKKTNLDEIAILNQVKILITTLGARGSLIKTKSETIQIKAGKPKKVFDPTGAGDAYRAGFLAGYLRSFDLKTCGQMGGVASCYAVEKYGTTQHTFTIKEFVKRYKENFGEEIKL